MGFKKPSTTVTSYIDKPGWFHVAVTRVEENPVYDGQMKDQVNVSLAVLNGTEPTQIKRETTVRLPNPNEGQKDGGEFCARVQCRVAAACDIMAIITNAEGQRQYCPINEVPEDADMEIDWVGQDHREDPENVPAWIVGKQLVVKLHEEEYQGKKSIKMDGAHAYHVEDPDVAHVPKDAASLKLGGYKLVAPPKAGAAGAPTPPPANAASGAEKPAGKPASGGTAKPAAASKPSGGKPAANGAKPVAAGAYDDL